MEKLKTIPLDAIIIPKTHIRVQSIDEKAIKKLADSINSSGLLVRIILRPIGSGGKYELVDGERRLRAFRSLYEAEGRKWIGIPAIVEEMPAKEAVRRQIVINENRADLTPFEKAKGYKMAWDTGYFTSYILLERRPSEAVRQIFPLGDRDLLPNWGRTTLTC